MSVHDYRINADVRRHLVSRWVDVTRLQIGTTNGVVYIMGFLGSCAEIPSGAGGDTRETSREERAVRLAQLVDKEVRRLPGVHDLVFKLENVHKKGRVWRAERYTKDPESERVAGRASRPWSGPQAPAGADRQECR